MLARPACFVDGMFTPIQGVRPSLTGKGIATNSTAGSTALTAENLSQGVLNRTGPGGGFTDTFPDADTLIAAMDNPQVGDSFDFVYRNGVAQAMTFGAGVGIVSGIGTLSCAASSTKLYMLTVLSNKRTTIKVVTTTNANAVLTAVRDIDIKDVMPGMGATGTGIGASAVVLGAALGATPDTGTITLSVNSTASSPNIAVTFFPRIQVDALGVMTN